MTSMYFLFVLLALPGIPAIPPPAGAPTLSNFNLTTDVADFTATGYVAIKTNYPTQGPVNYFTSILAVDKTHSRMLLDSGANGLALYLPNVTYVTIPDPLNPGNFLCGRINISFAAEITALELMNNKGMTWIIENAFPFYIPVSHFFGYASDNTQCQTSLASSWLVDSNRLVRRIFVDNPLNVPETIGDTNRTIEVTSKAYVYDSFILGIPSSGLFTVPTSCASPFDWCENFVPENQICLYPNGTFV